MADVNIQNLINECKQIQEDSTYTAEVHYLIGIKIGCKAFWLKIIPPIVAVITALLLLLGAPNWVSWITLLGALVTILNQFLEPDKKAKEHISAAKEFTVLKHDARSMHEAFASFMAVESFLNEVRRLRERYNWLAKSTPITDDKESWDSARENIAKGYHQADFRRGE